jgi:hypothetical protein
MRLSTGGKSVTKWMNRSTGVRSGCVFADAAASNELPGQTDAIQNSRTTFDTRVVPSGFENLRQRLAFIISTREGFLILLHRWLHGFFSQPEKQDDAHYGKEHLMAVIAPIEDGRINDSNLRPPFDHGPHQPPPSGKEEE